MNPLQGDDCVTFCAKLSKKCSVIGLRETNRCEVLKVVAACDMCVNSVGSDQPAVRASDGVCLVNSSPSGSNPVTCDARHPETMRICACE